MKRLLYLAWTIVAAIAVVVFSATVTGCGLFGGSDTATPQDVQSTLDVLGLVDDALIGLRAATEAVVLRDVDRTPKLERIDRAREAVRLGMQQARDGLSRQTIFEHLQFAVSEANLVVQELQADGVVVDKRILKALRLVEVLAE